MQSHREMSKNHGVERRITEVAATLRQISSLDFSFLIVVFVLVTVASVGLAARTAAAERSTTPPEEAKTPAFPYFAEITGDNVYFRSGPDRNFYESGKLNRGDKVKVVSKQFSWHQIVPPPKSFSWISMQYVEKDPENPNFGIVTADRVRVYAGSDRIRPHDSTSLQGKLNKGGRVTLTGQELDGYYKIAPPPFAYLWVSTNFTRPLPPTAKVEPVDTKPVVRDPSAGKTSAAGKTTLAGGLPPVVKFDPSVEPMVIPVGPTPASEETMSPGSRIEQYRALMERIKAEKTKPVGEQDYKAMKTVLTEIANDKDEEAQSAARYAKCVLKRVEGYELVLAIFERVRLQKEQLGKKMAGIEQERTAKLAEVKDLGRFAVTGELRSFILYGDGHYRIVDASGKMLCYALPSGPVSQRDLTSMIGKKVGIVGTIQPHLPTKKAMVRFSEIVPLN